MSKNHDKTMNLEEENIENVNNGTEEQAEQGGEATENTAETQVEDAPTAKKEEAELDPLSKAQLEAEQWKDKYIRLVAEFENYKKRTLKEKSELILNGSEKTISTLLPILDDFQRAIADTTTDATAIKEGFSLIYKKLYESFEKLGVKEIETQDADFNVDYHEAIAMVPGMGDDKKGKVIDCVQTGYTLNEKVIRHAKVAVGQ